jgi:hypothetical protein
VITSHGPVFDKGLKLWPDPRVVIENAHASRHLPKALRPFILPINFDQLFALQQLELLPQYARLRANSRPRVLAAAPAVTMVRLKERRVGFKSAPHHKDSCHGLIYSPGRLHQRLRYLWMGQEALGVRAYHRYFWPKRRKQWELLDDLKALQQLGEFFLIGGVVGLPLQALFRSERLVLAGLGVEPVIGVLEHFGDRGRFQEFAYGRKRRDTRVETLGARLKEGKARSPGWVLPRFELRFEVHGDVQEFIDASADVIGIAPDRVELNDQNVFRRKSVEIRPEVAREASEVSEKRTFHHRLK